MISKKLSILSIIFTSFFLQGQETIVRMPTISPDASKIAFGFDGDIWTLDLVTNQTSRLTIHQAYESDPIWNSESNELAFTSDRKGNTNIFTTNLSGGIPTQLTYFPTTDTPVDWLKNGDILFTTNRIYKGPERENEYYVVNQNGETPRKFMDAYGHSAKISPNGNLVAFEKGYCRISREDYDGPAQRDIYVYNIKMNAYTKVTTSTKNDHSPYWDVNGNLYFISAESGRYNIYQQKINENGSLSGSKIQITSLKNTGILSYSVSNNGTIIYNSGIEVFKIENNKTSKLNFNLKSDNRFNLEKTETTTSDLRDYSISPNGKMIALSINGEIFVKENDKENSVSNNVSNHSYNDTNPFWLDDKTLGFVSDREGQYEIYTVTSVDERVKLNRSLKNKISKQTTSESDIFDVVIAPDLSKIAYRVGRGKLIIASINNGKIEKQKSFSENWAPANDVSWSPDSKFIAYSQEDLDFDSEIYIQSVENPKQKMNVSMHPRSDSNPVWSEDGKKLAFVSNRSGDRNGINYDIWMVWLKKSDWEKTKLDVKAGDYYTTEIVVDEKSKKDKKVNVVIDEDRIFDRLEQVTDWSGNESNPFFSKDSKSIYFSSIDSDSEKQSLFKYNFEDKKSKVISGSNYSYNLKMMEKDIFLIASGKLKILDEKSDKITSHPHSVTSTINYEKLNEQVFEEGVRALTAGFYDPKYHGYDWDKIVKKYKPWVLSATNPTDYEFMYNTMLGQLNASHMGYRGKDLAEIENENVGVLGIDLENVKNGVLVKYVLPNSSASKTSVNLKKGDIITHVNGSKIEKNTNFYSLLKNQLDKEILLKLDSGNEIIVRTESSGKLSELRYEEWINSRKLLVDKFSNGKLGYIHIQGMNLPSFERFERELKASGYGKEGIVIDVRYNGGGWTTDRLMAVLTVKQHAYTVPRGATDNLQKDNKNFVKNYPFNERALLAVNTKPLVALCNESSYSNAEIFAHAFKSFGLGKLVGQPTFGAVISTGSYSLQNGSVRMPYRAWYVKDSGLNMEHGPAVPDYIVENKPGWKARGEDDQLKKAVEVLLADSKQ